MATESLIYTVKPPRTIQLTGKGEFHSGLKIVEITFQDPYLVDISEIHFKNYYTGSISIRGKKRQQGGGGEWMTYLKNFELMPYPHSDYATEDYFTITDKQFLKTMDHLEIMQIILKQPSPIWKDFKIEDLQLCKYQKKLKKGAHTLPQWITETSDGPPPDLNIKGIPSITALSQSLQELWGLTNQLQQQQANVSIGRYDVDNDYEIKLLSYT